MSGIHVIQQKHCLEETGHAVDVFHFHGRKNPLNYRKAVSDFKRVDLEKYDIVHAHHGQSGLIALSQNLRPVVVAFHGSDLQGIRDLQGRITLLGRILRISSRWVSKHANAVILVAGHLARYLPASVEYHVIPVGINVELFRPFAMIDARQALGLPSNEHLILFVGDPDRTEKRFWLAQKTVELLSDKFNTRLILAHNIPHQQMPLFMNACDALLVTSSTEGSPSVVKEALACNLPIVSTDVGDVRERIGNIEGCEVCADDRPETIAASLSRVLSRGQRINGRQAVLELDEKLLTQKVIQVYHRAIQGKRRT